MLVRASALSFGAADAAAIRSARLFFGTQKIGVVLSYEEPHVTNCFDVKFPKGKYEKRVKRGGRREIGDRISRSLDVCGP